MQTSFYFDQTRCSGCYACVLACQSWHSDSSEAISWREVLTFEKGTFPDVKVAFLSLGCCHCLHPACLEVCLVGAISKRESDGIVIVDTDVCLGKDECGKCKVACPYDIPKFGGEHNAKMQMCDFCLDRLERGQNPICVMVCPVEALNFGSIEELESKYNNATRETEGFVHDPHVSASILFNPKHN